MPTMTHTKEQKKAWHKHNAKRRKEIKESVIALPGFGGIGGSEKLVRVLTSRNYEQKKLQEKFKIKPNPHKSSGGEGKAKIERVTQSHG